MIHAKWAIVGSSRMYDWNMLKCKCCSIQSQLIRKIRVSHEKVARQTAKKNTKQNNEKCTWQQCEAAKHLCGWTVWRFHYPFESRCSMEFLLFDGNFLRNNSPFTQKNGYILYVAMNTRIGTMQGLSCVCVCVRVWLHLVVWWKRQVCSPMFDSGRLISDSRTRMHRLCPASRNLLRLFSR